jgi:hypothetical protein
MRAARRLLPFVTAAFVVIVGLAAYFPVSA